jgi:predicted GNAT family acetyltransferase
MDDLPIHHDIAARKFIALVDGHTGSMDYVREGDVVTITHTLVPPEIGGRGVAARLVEAAIAYARGEGLKIEPRCSYAAAWFARHPELADLRA